ncbi:MAG: VOC family protein [Chitinophagaceae bacterium]
MNNTIYPCLWFDGKAKDAAAFYCSIFTDSKIKVDTPMVVNFEIQGQKFMALNGGPQYRINPSISLFVICDSEAETDAVWNKFLDGGTVLMPLDKYEWSEKYGWVQDQFGMSWKISFGKFQDVAQKFTPALLFVGEQQGKAEEAVKFYTSVFSNSSITGIMRYQAGETNIEGTVKHAQFTISQYVMMAMDSSLAHAFAFNEAVSLVVNCETQNEVDHYWNKLTEGGQEGRCGWLKDKFGVSWQIVPTVLGKLMSDPARAERVMKAFMQMKKFDIQLLLQA